MAVWYRSPIVIRGGRRIFRLGCGRLRSGSENFAGEAAEEVGEDDRDSIDDDSPHLLLKNEYVSLLNFEGMGGKLVSDV